MVVFDGIKTRETAKPKTAAITTTICRLVMFKGEGKILFKNSTKPYEVTLLRSGNIIKDVPASKKPKLLNHFLLKCFAILPKITAPAPIPIAAGVIMIQDKLSS